MKETSLKTLKIFVRSITALAFALFTAYQIYMALKTDVGLYGRIIGIVCYTFLAAASVFSLIHQRGIRILRSVLFVAGLAGLFFMRLLSVARVFGALDFSFFPSVLNCSEYLASQLGTLVLLLYYLAVRTNKYIKNKRRVTIIMMVFVIAFFGLGLISEWTLRAKYGYNIDSTLQLTLISRVVYFCGFALTALNFMLPPTKVESEAEQYIIKEQSEAEILVSSSDENRNHPAHDKKRNPTLDDANIILNTVNSGRSRSHGERKRSPVLDEADIILDPAQTTRPHSHGEKKRSPVLDDADIVFSDTDNIHSKKHNR
ncbi:MAG: hypothetical protein IIZ23_02795 [Ruminococcus sp.]|nr:hypothetical protein [Ruminococcus sp.]